MELSRLAVLACGVSRQSGLHLRGAHAKRGSAESFERDFQLNQVCRGGRFEDTERAGDKEPGLLRGGSRIAVVDEQRAGREFERQGDRFAFAGAETQVDGGGVRGPDFKPSWRRAANVLTTGGVRWWLNSCSTAVGTTTRPKSEGRSSVSPIRTR